MLPYHIQFTVKVSFLKETTLWKKNLLRLKEEFKECCLLVSWGYGLAGKDESRSQHSYAMHEQVMLVCDHSTRVGVGARSTDQPV